MSTTAGLPGLPPVEGDPEQFALAAALASASLQRAPALRRLLLYLWEHREGSPGEFAIGVDVLGKRADFDPRSDAAVRVHVARLRGKLKEFFDNEGRDLPVQFTIPAGGHRLEVRPAVVPAAAPAAAPPALRRIPAGVAILAALCLVLSGLLVWLWSENRRLEQQAARTAAPAELPAFWRRTLGNGKLTRIVIPTPVFFQFGQLRVRDVRINDPSNAAASAGILQLERTLGKPSLTQSYSVTSDSMALATLTRMLSTGGIPLATGVTQDLSLELFGRDNLVFLGIPPTSPHVENMLARTEFYLGPGTIAVTQRHPRTGEQQTYPLRPEPSRRYGIISVLPGQAAGTRLVLLSGQHTSSLASFLASPVTLRELESYLARQGNPPYFEMVVAADVDGFNLLKAAPVAFRPVSASFWK